MTERKQRAIDLGDGVKKFREPRFYHAKVRCTNCFHGGDVTIPKGMTVDQYPCPACYCMRLEPIRKSKNDESS